MALLAVAFTIFLTNNRWLYEKPTGPTTQVVLPFTGLNAPGGVAVATNGDVYVTDTNNSRVLMLAAGWATPTRLPFTGLGKNVVDHKRVLKLAAGSNTPTQLHHGVTLLPGRRTEGDDVEGRFRPTA